jgi:glycosyltransferase involved in cell wall biosynthesis
MSQPLVSVFMPTFNHVRYIDDAIRCAVEQTYEPCEVVVGDDGSTDGTAEKVLDWARRLPGKVRSVGGDHLGTVANHNRTMSQCRGKYIACTSGDDMLLPEKVARQVQWMERDATRVMCGHDVEGFDSDTGQRLYLTSDARRLKGGRGASDFLARLELLPSTSAFLRASAIPPSRLDERAGIISDFKLQVDMLLPGGEYGYVDGILAKYRVQPKSISRQSVTDDDVGRQYFTGLARMLDIVEASNPELGGACREGRARTFFLEARRQHRRGRLTEARSYYGTALRLGPFDIRAKAAAGLAITYTPNFASTTIERFFAARRNG